MPEEIDHSDEGAAPPRDNQGLQFRLSTIFVLTLVATILAAFLNPRGSEMLLAGLVTVLCSLTFAFLVGHFRAPLIDRIFWGTVVAAMMEAVCAEVILLNPAGLYAWPIVAGFAAVVGAGKSHFYRRLVLSALTAGVIIGGYVLWLQATPTVMAGYLACASIGAALLTILIDFVRWTEQRFRIPQPAIGLSLVLGAIGFSVLAPKIIPGW